MKCTLQHFHFVFAKEFTLWVTVAAPITDMMKPRVVLPGEVREVGPLDRLRLERKLPSRRATTRGAPPRETNLPIRVCHIAAIQGELLRGARMGAGHSQLRIRA